MTLKDAHLPAFPQHSFEPNPNGGEPRIIWQEGMTLREYYAAHAPACPEQWMSRYARERGWGGDAKALADWSFAYADEMLKASKR